MKLSSLSHLIALTFVLLLTSCGSTGNAGSNQKSTTEINWSADLRDISVEQIPALKKKYPKLTILDVRTPQEIENGKIKGAHQYNIQSKAFKSEMSELNKEAPYLVYCAAGNRSARACDIMKGLGFKTTYNLKGGYKDYVAKQD